MLFLPHTQLPFRRLYSLFLGDKVIENRVATELILSQEFIGYCTVWRNIFLVFHQVLAGGGKLST